MKVSFLLGDCVRFFVGGVVKGEMIFFLLWTGLKLSIKMNALIKPNFNILRSK
jgi:hypothetical protein